MSANPASLSPPETLQATIERIQAMNHLAPQRRQDLCSALRRLANLIGQPANNIPAAPALLRQKLTLFTPAGAGVTPRRWQNIKALVSAALDMCGAKMVRRRHGSLPPAWAELMGRVKDRYERSRLSRLASHCAARGIEPLQVDDSVAASFGAQLLQDSLIDRPKQVHRDACLAWNRSADSIPGWPGQHLTVPDHRRTYALPLAAYPLSFAADLEAWLHHLSGEDLFGETARRPCAPATLLTNRRLALQFAAALVHTGRDPASITSLADFVTIDAAKAGLSYFWERAGREKTAHLHHYGMLLVKLAKHWAKVSPEQLVQLQAMCHRIDPGHTGMTPRNRARLRQFTDTANVTRLVGLPRAIQRALPNFEPLGYEAAIQLQSAVGIAVLLAAPMRIKNLASLTLDRHLLQTREGGPAHLVLPRQEVKNKAALEFPLPPEVVALIQTYIRHALPVLAGGPCHFLFPARSGGTKPEAQLSVQLKKAIARHAGLDLNVHAFRHLASMLFLRRHPGEYQTVSLLLGHKSLATTVRAYCGLEDIDAFRRYDQLIDGYRQHRQASHAG